MPSKTHEMEHNYAGHALRLMREALAVLDQNDYAGLADLSLQSAVDRLMIETDQPIPAEPDFLLRRLVNL